MPTIGEKFDEARKTFLHNWEASRKTQGRILEAHLNEIGEIIAESRTEAEAAAKIVEEREALNKHLGETTLLLETSRGRVAELEAANLQLQEIAGVREHIEREIAAKRAELAELEGRLVNKPE